MLFYNWLLVAISFFLSTRCQTLSSAIDLIWSILLFLSALFIVIYAFSMVGIGFPHHTECCMVLWFQMVRGEILYEAMLIELCNFFSQENTCM